MSRNWVDKKAKNVVWLTPPKILEPVRAYFAGQIPLDPATQPSNPTDAWRFFTEKDDGLAQIWDLPTFVNPPYSKLLRLWVAKIHREAKRASREIIAVLPCGSGRHSTRYWQDDVLNPFLTMECHVRGRVDFLLEDGVSRSGNSYPTLIAGYNCPPERFARCFGALGKVSKVSVLN